MRADLLRDLEALIERCGQAEEPLLESVLCCVLSCARRDSETGDLEPLGEAMLPCVLDLRRRASDGPFRRGGEGDPL